MNDSEELRILSLVDVRLSFSAKSQPDKGQLHRTVDTWRICCTLAPQSDPALLQIRSTSKNN